MKYLPTNIILEMAEVRNVKHLFGKLWWDADYRKVLKGDKKIKKNSNKTY